MSGKTLYCFVCDIAVTNRYFSLATCRTQSSKKKLIEKLGNLVGEKYLVVITEDDVICRSCANLMNTLDRLEVEMGSVRRVVLRFLERKYSLEEGELLNQKQNVNSQSDVDKQTPSFMVKKKKGDDEIEDETDCNPDDPRSRIWMQCDKCQYTTNYTSFVKNHIRDEVCLDCEGQTLNGVCIQNCNVKPKIGDDGTIAAAGAAASAAGPGPVQAAGKTDSEPMELIVNNINFLNGTNEEALSLISEPNLQGKFEVTLNVNESGEISFAEKKEAADAEVDGEDGEEKEEKPALYLQVVDEEEDDFENGNVRQVLAVTGDGAVEMMEIMWNEETNSPVAEIPF